MGALVGVCRHGGERTRMVSDLDRASWDGVGALESHGHSLDGATGPREPRKGLSRVPTDDEFVHSMVSQDEMTQVTGLSPARPARARFGLRAVGDRRTSFRTIAWRVKHRVTAVQSSDRAGE